MFAFWVLPTNDQEKIDCVLNEQKGPRIVNARTCRGWCCFQGINKSSYMWTALKINTLTFFLSTHKQAPTTIPAIPTFTRFTLQIRQAATCQSIVAAWICISMHCYIKINHQTTTSQTWRNRNTPQDLQLAKWEVQQDFLHQLHRARQWVAGCLCRSSEILLVMHECKPAPRVAVA